GDAGRERNWFRFQVAVYRAYLGAPAPTSKAGEPKAGEEAPKRGELQIGDELPNQKKEFDAGTLGKDYDDYRSAKGLIERLANLSKWDKNLPEKTYPQLLAELKSQNDQLAKHLRFAQDEVALAKKHK